MSDFKTDFLDNYLKLGLGAMPKSDIDALVMHLIDTYGVNGSGPLATLSNQAVSESLKTPVSKIKSLRYNAALKFGKGVEDEAKGRLLAALSNAALEPDGKNIHLIIEDSLAKNWLQGQLKKHQYIFDNSFNTEIVKVSAAGLFKMLETIFDKNREQLEVFKNNYNAAKKEKRAEAAATIFKNAALKFAEGAAQAAGELVVSVFKARLGSV